MKILYLGSVISDDFADEITRTSKTKPSTAAVNFQRNLLKGMQAENMEIHSLPPIPTFPNGEYFAWGSRKEAIFEGTCCKLIPAINLPLFKQLSVLLSTFFVLLCWSVRNRKEKEKVILQYGQYAYYTIPITVWARLFKIKTCDIVTDPISYSSKYSSEAMLKKLAIRIDWAIAECFKKGFDSYVFLTKYLIEAYSAEEKPHIILEGIADSHIFDGIPSQQKADPPAVMYAGALTKGFGIPALLGSMEKMEASCQLWLFGDGDCITQIQEASRKDPRIRYFGKVPRRNLLESMLKATLLVSTKPVAADHTRFQFPSKIMEYMVSGTPVASTAVLGIPEEYFTYVYKIAPDTAEGIAETIKAVLTRPQEELAADGQDAKKWIQKNKTYLQQSQRIIELLYSVVRQEAVH